MRWKVLVINWTYLSLPTKCNGYYRHSIWLRTGMGISCKQNIAWSSRWATLSLLSCVNSNLQCTLFSQNMTSYSTWKDVSYFSFHSVLGFLKDILYKQSPELSALSVLVHLPYRWHGQSKWNQQDRGTFWSLFWYRTVFTYSYNIILMNYFFYQTSYWV